MSIALLITIIQVERQTGLISTPICLVLTVLLKCVVQALVTWLLKNLTLRILTLLLLLLWVFQTVSFAELWRSLSRLGLGQLVALAVLNGLILVSMSGRWWLILRAQGYTVPYLTLTGYRLAAFGVSYFTPGPQFGGEPLQVYLVRRHHGVPGSTAEMSIAGVLMNVLYQPALAESVWLWSSHSSGSATATVPTPRLNWERS